MPTPEELATEALAEAFAEDGKTDEATRLDARVAEIKESKPEVAAVESTDGATETDSFTKIDFNELPAELQDYAKSLQGDYTRKTQALAETRKQYEALEEFGGLDTALEAVQFAQNLASDPQFALEVQEQLFDALTTAGMSPKAAAAEVARQTEEVIAASTPDPLAEEYGADDPLVKELNAVKAQLSEVADWKKQQDLEASNRNLANQIQLQENEILSKNPDYVQDDIDDIYRLAYSTNGDLLAAEKLYSAQQARMLDSYLSRKASVSTGVGGIQSNGVTQAVTPVEFDGLYDPKLEALVQERLAQEIAAGN